MISILYARISFHLMALDKQTGLMMAANKAKTSNMENLYLCCVSLCF